MFRSVYALCLFCIIKSSVASLSDYYEGHDSLISQTYKHGDNGISAGDTSLLGKQPEIKAEGSSSLAYDNSIRHGGSHSGINVPGHEEIYSYTPVHSGDLSLSSLDLSKHTSDQVKTLQGILQGSEFLSGYSGHTNNYNALDSLSLGNASPGGLHDVKDNGDIYRSKPTDSEELSLSSLNLAKQTSGVKSLYGSKFLSGYSASSKNHGFLTGYSANSNDHGSLSGHSANSNNHGILSGYSANSNNHGSLLGYSSNSNNHGLLSEYSANSNNHGLLSGYSANSNNHGSLLGYSANTNNHGSLSGYSSNSNNHGSLSAYSANTNNHGFLGYALFGGLHDTKPLYHENENYIKHVLQSSDSGTLKGVKTLNSAGDSHSFLPIHVSSSGHLRHSENTGHDEAHSDFRRLADTLVRGWTALLNH